MGPINFEKLDKLAELSVSTGVALQKGQNLLITAPSDALPLVRLIVKHAYKAGAGLVTPFFSDSEITLARYKYASNESFDVAADWLYKGMGEAFDNNTARMAIAGDDPMLYQIWIQKELREQIKLTLKLTNQQEKELHSLILTGIL